MRLRQRRKLTLIFLANLIVIVAVLIPLLACDTGGKPYKDGKTGDLGDAEVVMEWGNGTVVYYHDEEHEVGVWVFYGDRRGGMAVLPDEEYKR